MVLFVLPGLGFVVNALVASDSDPTPSTEEISALRNAILDLTATFGLRALDMAGRADTDANDVLAGRAVAELVVERADAFDVGRTDRRQLADALQRLARQVAIVELQGLEDRQDLVGLGADVFQALIDERKVQRLTIDY
jgi:hypothetical protein